MASSVTPSSSIAPRSFSASSPGSTMSARSLPSRRSRKQFSCTGPTVNIRTSTSAALRLAQLSLVDELVGVVAQRDVEEEHERAEPERRSDLLVEQQDHQGDEQH